MPCSLPSVDGVFRSPNPATLSGVHKSATRGAETDHAGLGCHGRNSHFSRAPRHEDAECPSSRPMRGLSPANARSRRMFLGNCSASICSRRRTAMNGGIGGRRTVITGGGCGQSARLNRRIGALVKTERSLAAACPEPSPAHQCLAKTRWSTPCADQDAANRPARPRD